MNAIYRLVSEITLNPYITPLYKYGKHKVKSKIKHTVYNAVDHPINTVRKLKRRKNDTDNED